MQVKPSTDRRPNVALLLFCFFISGSAGLIYQVAWSKSLGLIFGQTVYAVATVLTVFMAGLAAGSAVLGRWSEKCSNALMLYGWVELAVAVTGALSPVGIAAVRSIYLAVYPAVGGSAIVLVVVRFLASAAVLLPPTFLMGGTLPILVRGLTHSSEELGGRLGRLYWVNTLGAVVGTLAAGFVFLPSLGLKMTLGIAVGLNVVAGSLALVASRRSFDQHHPSRGFDSGFALSGSRSAAAALPSLEASPYRARASRSAEERSSMLLVAFAMVGLTAMVYEVAWSRLLATTLASSTYAFTLMLATFLVGMTLGSFLFEWWLRRGKLVTRGTFATTQLFIGVAVLLFLTFFQEHPGLAAAVLRLTDFSFRGMLLAQFVGSALAMLPAAVIFGFNFPVVTLLVAHTREDLESNGAAVGNAYAANTLGAIAGAVAAGFLLVPWLGSFRTVALAAGANIALGLLLELQGEARRWISLTVGAAALVLVVSIGWFKLFYSPEVANFGALLNARGYASALSTREVAETSKVIFERDGLNATISVAEGEGYTALRTNGKPDASTLDAPTQLMVAHVGAGFHPAPKRVLVIGFGSGMTVAALARYPDVERIDCVEIEPAVLAAAPYLKSLNRGVLADPRLHLFLDDARNFLLTTREQYDLIVSEPSNPWIAGVSALFTKEFYAQARMRLQPGGIFVQWVQGYRLYPDDLRMILGTFVPHFSQVTMWRGAAADYALVGQSRAEPLSLARLNFLWSNDALREDFEPLGITRPEGLIAYCQLDDVDLRRLATGADQNTDDLTQLEYRAPRGLVNLQLAELNRLTIWRYRTSSLPRSLQVSDEAAALQAAAQTLLNVSTQGDISPTMQLTQNIEVLEEAGYFLAALNNAPSTPQLQLLRGKWNVGRRALPQARQAYEAALKLAGDSPEAMEGLATVAYLQGDLAGAEKEVQQALSAAPGHPPAMQIMALVESARQRWAQAADWESHYIATLSKPSANEYARLGTMLSNGGEAAKAEPALQKAVELEPYSFVGHRNLAEICLRGNRWPCAVEHLEFLVRYYPTVDSTVYQRLAEAYRSHGDRGKANQIIRKGVRLFGESFAQHSGFIEPPGLLKKMQHHGNSPIELFTYHWSVPV
jgi:spermidine synthase